MRSRCEDRTHYCPDSDFMLISENDLEFEACNCFKVSADRGAPNSFDSFQEVHTGRVRNSVLAAEQLWYRTLAALANVVGTAKPAKIESPAEQQEEMVLSKVHKD